MALLALALALAVGAGYQPVGVSQRVCGYPVSLFAGEDGQPNAARLS